jgi:hypothetical protein
MVQSLHDVTPTTIWTARMRCPTFTCAPALFRSDSAILSCSTCDASLSRGVRVDLGAHSIGVRKCGRHVCRIRRSIQRVVSDHVRSELDPGCPPTGDCPGFDGRREALWRASAAFSGPARGRALAK